MVGAELLGAVAGLAHPVGRAEAARRLAVGLEVDEVILFVADPRTGKLLPAPGFPQTLPGSAGWRALLAATAAGGATGEVTSPSTGQPMLATAVAGADGSAMVLLGGEPDRAALEKLRLLMPLVGAALGHERAVAVAEAEAHLARSAAAEARRLAEALDAARVDLDRLYRQVQQALQFRDEFLAAVAHDLRTPLTAITGYIQMLRRRMERGVPGDEERQRRAMSQIETTSVRMRRLVDQIVDVARLQMGQALELNRRSVDLVALARRVAAEHEPLADRHDVRVVTDEPELVGEWDSVRLERVLDNLLSNAIKYSPAGGEIVVRVGRETGGRGDWAVLRVSDPGVGVPAADLRRVFDRFHRAGNATGFVGSGIGLASVRQIVQEHGGEVSAESVEGEGTTFTVRLPLQADPAGAASSC